jgi:transglutaminase-like putative cysteine protease
VHHTRYRYTRPVSLEPHLLRLTPRGDAAQRLVSVATVIRPEPVGISPCTDLYGNTVLSVWFAGLTDRLDIDVACEVTTLRRNPFDFLPDPARSRLPVVPATDEAVLAPCLVPPPVAQPGAIALARRLLEAGADTPQDFPWALVTWMGGNLTPIVRQEPGLLAPDTVLATGRGACRDLAVCAMTACRAVGLPARFVSGYQEGDPDRDERDLHAWFEVWLPGGGWRGYDPTHGLAVSDRHVALAAAPEPEGAAPVVGAFRGDEATVALSHDVRLEMF